MRAERLVRAAVTAFCSLTRPSRSEIAQLDDLAMPLYDQLSVETRRYMAAALSECEYAPALLVRRLCDDTIEIAAPLLVRSPLLREIDLVALIGRHGLPHARVIARRPDLDSTIAALVRALEIPSMKIAAEKPLPQVAEPAPEMLAFGSHDHRIGGDAIARHELGDLGLGNRKGRDDPWLHLASLLPLGSLRKRRTESTAVSLAPSEYARTPVSGAAAPPGTALSRGSGGGFRPARPGPGGRNDAGPLTISFAVQVCKMASGSACNQI